MRTGNMHRLEHPEEAYTCYATSNHVFNSGTLRFGYQSMVSPRSVYDYDMDTRWAESRTESDFVSEDKYILDEKYFTFSFPFFFFPVLFVLRVVFYRFLAVFPPFLL